MQILTNAIHSASSCLAALGKAHMQPPGRGRGGPGGGGGGKERDLCSRAQESLRLCGPTLLARPAPPHLPSYFISLDQHDQSDDRDHGKHDEKCQLRQQARLPQLSARDCVLFKQYLSENARSAARSAPASQVSFGGPVVGFASSSRFKHLLMMVDY